MMFVVVQATLMDTNIDPPPSIDFGRDTDTVIRTGCVWSMSPLFRMHIAHDKNAFHSVIGEFMGQTQRCGHNCMNLRLECSHP